MYYGTRLEAGRALANVTQQELADATGFKQPYISMITRGERLLSDGHAQRFADALGLPVEFFSIPPSSVPDTAVDFRKLKSTSARDTDRARTLFKEAFRVTSSLFDRAEQPAPVLPIIQDSARLEDDRIEEIAQEVRRRFRVVDGAPISNVARTLERYGIAVAPLVVPGAREPADQSKHFGASHWSGVGEVALVSYVPGSSGDRDRFTLCHELAHLVLHTFRTHVDPDERESEANRLASAILLPRDEIASSINRTSTLKNVAAAKAQWGASMQAIIMRAKSIGAMPDDRAAMLFRQISARGWRKAEPVHVPHEPPRLLRTMLEQRYGPAPAKNPFLERELGLPFEVVQSIAPVVRVGAQPRRDGGSVIAANFGR